MTGDTFQADPTGKNGMVASSAIDHVDYSKDLTNQVETIVLENSTSDHSPVVCKHICLSICQSVYKCSAVQSAASICGTSGDA